MYLVVDGVLYGTFASQYLVVDVEAAFSLVLRHHPRLLQQEVGDLPSVRFSSTTELDLKVLPLGAERDRVLVGLRPHLVPTS